MSPWMRLAQLAMPVWRPLALGAGLMTVTVLASVALLGTSAWLIATAALHPSIAVLQVAVVGVRFFGLARGVARYLERLVSHDATLRLLARLRVTVFLALAPRVPGLWRGRASGDVFARLLSDVDTVEHAYLRIAGPILTAMAAGAAAVTALAWIAPVAALAGVAGLVVAGVGGPLLAWRLGHDAGVGVVHARAALNAGLVDAVQGASDLAIFGASGRLARTLDRDSARLASSQRGASGAASVATSGVGLVADLTALAVIALLAPAVAMGEVTGVALTVAVLVTLASFEAVAPLPAAFQAIGGTAAAAARLFDTESTPPASSAPPAPRALPALHALTLSSLSFTYPDTGRPALIDVSLHLAPGRLVAVVGESGAGKSTLVQLLLRFFETPRGAVLVDGADLTDWDADTWRRQVAWMPQRAALFAGTLAENLRLAKPDASDAELHAALARAGLAATVAAWPDGLATWVGEHGARLSGGERQRVALARVLLRDAPLVLLDEPTAQVDAVTEAALVDECFALAERRAVLLVTHRVAGLARAGEIVVLRRGVVVERGTFASLAAREHGTFRRLLDRQQASRDAAPARAAGHGRG